MKNILMIATGGTIASKEGDLGLTPAVTGEELAASVPGIKDICHLEILQLMNIDSTNMRPRQWLMIRDAIMENYNNYDGFVVLHGTDTMAYTAAALSYLIQDSVKPIVLTGSQKPMANPYTDAKLMLEETGICVECAADGKEAVAKFEESEPGYYDVIFMDIMMPYMNGWDATRKIRTLQRPDADKIPIIAMSANAFAEDIINSHISGMNWHLTKPIDADKLMTALKECIRKNNIR